MFKVLFVCSGNTCRSPMAEAFFNHLIQQNGLAAHVRAYSAGTSAVAGAPATEQAQESLAKLGLSLQQHRSRLVSEDMIAEADAIVCMTDKHLKTIKKNFPAHAQKLRALLSVIGSVEDVDDPHGGDQEIYDECFLLMMPALAELCDRILRSRQQP